MRGLAAPNLAFRELYSICVDGKREPARTNLLSLLPGLEGCEASYRCLAGVQRLYEFPVQPPPLHFADAKAELTKLYDERLAKNPSPGRANYDQILAAGLPRCPYCNHNRPRQLDHVLPKEADGYPELSIVPSNLVPTCADCNFHKRNHRPTGYQDQFFHPYFESPSHVDWLFAHADFSETGDLTVGYTTAFFQGYDAFSERIRFQFEQLKLGELYSAQAASELESIRYALNGLYDAGGSEAVRGRILEDFNSFRHSDQNSWKTALYRCLSDSARFCNMDWSL